MSLLTPVRVRGKRPRPPSPPTRKTRRSLAEALAARSRLRSSRLRTRHASGRSLDSLPPETLELVLLYSANLALPRASPLLGARLSGRATLIRLLLWVFHPSWLVRFGLPPDPGQAADPRLQSALLDLPWAHLDLILQAQQTWANRYARGRHCPHCHPAVPFDARRCFATDLQEALAWRPMVGEPGPWSALRRHDVDARTRLPPRLLAGPWDEEKVRRLFWLRRAGALLDPEHGRPLLPWELRLHCLDQAVVAASEPSTLLANCLLSGTRLLSHLPRDHVRKRILELDRRLHHGRHSPPVRDILRRTSDLLISSLKLIPTTRPMAPD